MGVDPVGSPVSGPAGVGDAAPAGWQSAVQRRREITDLSRALLDGEGAAVQDGQSGGVVAPVLEALQALQKNRGGRAGTQIADDAAHGALLLVRVVITPLVGPPHPRCFRLAFGSNEPPALRVPSGTVYPGGVTTPLRPHGHGDLTMTDPGPAVSDLFMDYI